MKAIRLHARGGTEQLRLEEAPMPVMQAGDALVRVLASGITRNELDWGPTYTDEQGNSRLPTIPGHELCGIVDAVAEGVTGVEPGDVVYGLTSFFRNGTAAEYIAVRAADLAPKPRTLEAYQAAAVPLAALTAWQALFDRAGLMAGQKVLIHGAAGGVGGFAVQLAKWRGAYVTGATSAATVGLVKELGAHTVIDYGAASFETKVREADIVLDTVGGEIQARSWSVLKKGGILISVAGEGIEVPPDRTGVFFIVSADRQELIKIGQLIDQGILKPVIAAVLPLEQARAAFEKMTKPGKSGKVVLTITQK